jgi:hypothetical protein
MSGAALIVIIGIYERFTRKQVSGKRYVWLMLLFVFYASFLAWQDENNRAASISKELNQVRAAKEKLEQEVPLIKFDHYQWYKGMGDLSCDNPAYGINVYFQNKSSVPVVVEKRHLAFYMGDKSILNEPGITIGGSIGERILAKGELSSAFRQSPDFESIYKNLRGMQLGDLFRFKLSVTYRSILTGKRYGYETEVLLFEDCNLPSQRHFQQNNEKIEIISN